MANRTGEKIGWTAGWLGGFIWVLILAIVFLFQKQWIYGITGLILVGIAVIIIISCAPWRHPSTPYSKLLLAPYLAFFVSIAWAIWSYGGFKAMGLNWWFCFWFVPMLIPFGSLTKKKWNDAESSPD